MEIPFYSVMALMLFLVSSLVADLGTDQSSLLALKSQITSDPYNVLTNNWTSKTSVCSWIGVTCSHRHNRVTALSISNMGLRGIIPPEIGNLSFLVSLNMDNNFFYGNLPMDLSRLRRLRVVDFGRNNFTRELPKSWFGSLHQLEILVIGRNSLQGMIPLEIGNFSKLKLLVLEYNQLTGPLPPTIFNISTLEMVYLSGNILTGSLPDNICSNYNRFKFLSLQENMLQGQIPLSWCQCSQLEALFLSFNKLSGSVPSDIGNMTALHVLRLRRNNLTGVIPKQIGHLHNLKILVIGENNIVGVIPQVIGYLNELEFVDLSMNLLSGSIPLGIFNMSKLKVLGFGDNLLTGKFPTKMSFNLPSLERLYLNENELSGPILSFITNSSYLYILEVSSNNFGGSIPNTLGNNLRFIQILNLQTNNFTIDNEPSTSQELNFITSLTNCRFLRAMLLDNNPLDAILPSYVGNLSESLQKVTANFCQLKGHIPKWIGNLSNLEILFLGGNDLVGFIPPSSQGLQKIEQLVLAVNKLIGYFPYSFCTFQNLGALSLMGNQISGPIPECLGNVTSLRYLYLDHNKFNSTIPTHLWHLTGLLELDLSSNFLSGSFSPDIGNLKVAYYINMSMNAFSGSIPATIESLLDLINMSLAHNRLHGPIPDSVNKMLSLERLDLSDNNLSGVIPKSLETLQHLIYFNVSFNNLSGEIPSDGPFTNFTYQSFMFNNKDLCGALRFGVPPCAINSLQTPRKKNKFNKVAIVSLGVAVGIIIITLAVLVLIKYRKKNHSTHNVSLSLSPQRQRRISYYELQQATNGFDDSNLLGTGGFSSVYKGVLQDGTLLAAKVFTLEVQGSLKGFDAECEVLRNLRHINLTKVICSCSNEDFKALILDYMPNGSLDKWLYSHNHFLDILQRLNIMIDVASALEYLHHGYSTLVIHCDLKPSNVLLDEDMVGHVSDFGMAKMLSKEQSATHTRTLATLSYMAPEYGMEGIVSSKCDVYSYGIMLMEVFTRTKPNDEMFSGELDIKTWVQNSMPNEVMNIVDANLLDPNNELMLNEKLKCLASIMELAISCTAQSPKDRITMKDILLGLEKLKSKLLQRQ